MGLTANMISQIKSDIKDDIEAIWTYIGAGEDTAPFDASDTELGLEVIRKAPAEVDKSVANKITASLQIGTGEANNNTIGECGTFNAAEEEVDNCDTADWTDSADMTTSLNESEYKENTKALNLTKDAGASATASTYKTTTSVNFTSKNLSLWLYVKDATARAKLATSSCLTIRFGSDSSNYYQWAKDLTDLSVGWNLIKNLTSSNADSTTGSPTITACDYTYVALTATAAATTWSAGDFIMDDIKLTSGTMWTRNTFTAINKTDDIQLYLDQQAIISVIDESSDA